MSTWLAGCCSLRSRFAKAGAASALLTLLSAASAWAQETPGGEAGLKLPDLSQVTFLGVDGHKLLTIGILFCVFGLIFGLAIYSRLKNLPVHRAMRDVSELIYETCKTYLFTQGKFLLFLWVFIAIVIVLYFGVLSPVPDKPVGVTLPIILLFSLLGMAGSYGVAWFGIRVNTFANSRTAFAALRGKPYPCYAIPLSAGMSIGMLLISVELVIMLGILLFVPGDYAGPCFIGFAIGESLGAAALRIAGGIFTKIADIGSYLMIPDLGDGTLWWKLSSVITCGTLAGAIIPEFVKVFTSTESRHVREVVTSSREGGASLNILSGLVAGNFSAYWLGITIMALMAIGYFVSGQGLDVQFMGAKLMLAPAVFAFGLGAFGFLGMGPVTIAVD